MATVVATFRSAQKIRRWCVRVLVWASEGSAVASVSGGGVEGALYEPARKCRGASRAGTSPTLGAEVWEPGHPYLDLSPAHRGNGPRAPLGQRPRASHRPQRPRSGVPLPHVNGRTSRGGMAIRRLCFRGTTTPARTCSGAYLLSTGARSTRSRPWSTRSGFPAIRCVLEGTAGGSATSAVLGRSRMLCSGSIATRGGTALRGGPWSPARQFPDRLLVAAIHGGPGLRGDLRSPVTTADPAP